MWACNTFSISGRRHYVFFPYITTDLAASQHQTLDLPMLQTSRSKEYSKQGIFLAILRFGGHAQCLLLSDHEAFLMCRADAHATADTHSIIGNYCETSRLLKHCEPLNVNARRNSELLLYKTAVLSRDEAQLPFLYRLYRFGLAQRAVIAEVWACAASKSGCKSAPWEKSRDDL